MIRAWHLGCLFVASWVVVGAVLWVLHDGSVTEGAVLVFAALVLVAVAWVLGRECDVCCETRRLRS